MDKVVYKISPGYTSCTAWVGDIYGKRIGTFKRTPKKELTRYAKYIEISDFLYNLGAKAPAYVPTKKEIERGDFTVEL